MAKVIVYTQGGDSYTVEASGDDVRFYEELPFTSSNVMATEVKEDK